MEDKKIQKRNKILRISGLIGLFLLVFGLSYALFTVTLNGTKKVKIKTGKLELQLLDSNNNPIYVTGQNSESSYAINLDNQVPVSDETGLGTQAFEFKLKNTGNIKASYTIYLDDVALEEGESRIDDEYIRYSLTKNGSEENPQALSSRELDKGTIDIDNTTNEYTLKIWIAENAINEAMDKVFNATLRVEGTQYVQNGPFEEGTMAATLYNASDKLTLSSDVANGFNSENESDGLYKYTDEEGTETYVYRGVDPNNYVDFAGQTWRILRIQSDGTVKLIRDEAVNYENTDYDSGSATDNGVTYRRIQYNKTGQSDDDSKYSTSNIKSYVEAWYNATMTSYDSKIATNEYCSDRTEDHTSAGYTGYFGNNDWTKLYGLYNRVNWGDYDPTDAKYEGENNSWNDELYAQDIATVTLRPSVSCTTEKINSKVALITADEYILAGGRLWEEVNNYLVKGYYYWTMSPAGFSGNATSYSVSSYDYIGDDSVNDSSNGVLPVITLNANLAISSGEGTALSPYVIS